VTASDAGPSSRTAQDAGEQLTLANRKRRGIIEQSLDRLAYRIRVRVWVAV
jgi:hypothetical protein